LPTSRFLNFMRSIQTVHKQLCDILILSRELSCLNAGEFCGLYFVSLITNCACMERRSEI